MKVAADLIVDHRTRLLVDRQSLGLGEHSAPARPDGRAPKVHTQSSSVSVGGGVDTAGVGSRSHAQVVSQGSAAAQSKAAQPVSYWPLTIVVLLALLAVGIVIAAQRSADAQHDDAVRSQSADATGGTALSSGDSSAVATLSESPADSLAHLRDADLPTVESYVGQWVPQLASMPSGDGDVQFATTQESLGLTYGALVVGSDDFIFDNTGYWVSLAPSPVKSPVVV